MQLRRSQKIFKTVKPSTIERMTPPSLNGDVSLFLCIGVNHLEGDVRSSRSKWLTSLQDTRSKSVEIGKIFTDLDPSPTDPSLQDLCSCSTNLEPLHLIYYTFLDHF